MTNTTVDPRAAVPSAALPPAERRPAAWEAARYGILRRLGPALKHDMVVNLQAMAMMSEVLGAKLEKGASAGTDVQQSIARIHRLAREAVANCLRVSSWIDTPEDEAIALQAGVQECVALVRSNFSFRGIELDVQVTGGEFEVSRALLRHLLVATMIGLTDERGVPGCLRVHADASAGHALVAVRFEPGRPDADALPFEPNYRRLDWADVAALAQGEQVDLHRAGDAVTLRLPRMVPTSALQIAPL